MSDMSYRSAKAHLVNMVTKMENDARAFAKLGEVIALAAKAEDEASKLERRSRDLQKECDEMEKTHADMVGKLSRVKTECKGKEERASADCKERLKEFTATVKAASDAAKEQLGNIRSKTDADIEQARNERKEALASLAEATEKEAAAVRSLNGLKGRLAKVANV